MKVLYSYVKGMEPIYIDKSNGCQRVLLVLEEDFNTYVYYCDDYYSKTYINRIISRQLSGFNLDNFARIESDEEFKRLDTYITNNYNYDGQHIKEKVDGV